MMEFPYLEWRGRGSPIVMLSLRTSGRSIRSIAYLDTGATYSVFHADFCLRLGLRLDAGEPIDLKVGDGTLIPVYMHDLELHLENIHIMARIGFSERLGTGINILGRDTILDEYLVCFDGVNRRILWHT